MIANKETVTNNKKTNSNIRLLEEQLVTSDRNTKAKILDIFFNFLVSTSN